MLDTLDAVHGGWINPLDEYVRPSEKYFEGMESLFFVSGHSHVPCLWCGKVKKYCNPGSVGQPRDGDWRASFATWDGGSFEVHRVEYDVEATQRAMFEAGFAPFYFENLSKGTRIGGQIETFETSNL